MSLVTALLPINLVFGPFFVKYISMIPEILGVLKNRSDLVLRPSGLADWDQTEVQIRTWIRPDSKTYHDQHISFVYN